jgi:hypothetical protein
MDDEIERLGRPTPVAVARLGPKLLGSLVLERLKSRGLESVTESQYRRELRTLLAELVDTSRESLAQQFSDEIEVVLANTAARVAMKNLEDRGAVITTDSYIDEMNRVKGAIR